MSSMVEKGIKGGICRVIHQYMKTNNKYMKDYDKNKEWLYLKYFFLIHMDGQCCKSYHLVILSGLKKYLNLMKIS